MYICITTHIYIEYIYIYEHIYRFLALEIGISELCHMRFLLVWIYDARITRQTSGTKTILLHWVAYPRWNTRYRELKTFPIGK